jgi:hypothetical protein
MRYLAFLGVLAVTTLTACSDVKEEVSHLKEEASHIKEEAIHIKQEATHFNPRADFGPGPD